MGRHDNFRPVHALQDNVMDQQVQPFPYAVPKYIRVLCRKLLLGKNSGPNGIINIMVDVGNLI